LGAERAAVGFARLPSPVDEAGVGSPGARIAGAGHPLVDAEQRGELVAGTSRVSRLPVGGPSAVADALCLSDGVQHRSAVHQRVLGLERVRPAG
jgi:hypothetical protein